MTNSASSKTLPLFPNGEKYDPRDHGADCDNCPSNNLPVVPPTVPASVKAIIVGQEPGFAEVRAKTFFIGPAGKRLDRILTKHDLKREDMHLTNAVLCLAKDDEGRAKSIKCCAPRLQNEINAYDKSVPVIPLGAVAFKSVMERKIPITLARGFLWRKNDRDILPTLHPAFVLKDGIQWPLFSRDFRRISKRIRDGFLQLEVPKTFIVPRTTKELAEVLKKFGPVVSCDIETSEEQPTLAKLQCIGISDVETTAVVPWDEKFKFLLRQFFKRREKIIFHNGYAFDSIVLLKHKSMVLKQYGIDIKEDQLEDTLIAHHVYASHFPQRLDHLVSFYLDAEPWKIKFGKRVSAEKGQAKNISEEDLFKYNALDVHHTARLWQEMQEDLKPWIELYKQDKELAAMCRDMQLSGAFVDVELKNQLSKDIKAKEERLYIEMKELAKRDFSPTKPVELREIIYDQFGAPVIERTNTGLKSTNKQVLTAFSMKQDRPYGAFCKKIIEWRACAKMRVTYLDNLIIESDGRVHPSWRSFGAVSGRFAARKPNLMNLKRPDKRYKNEPEQKIRMIYTVPKGRKLVSFDMSQVEPRVTAYISQDPNYIKSVESGDIHTANARLLFGDLPCLMDSHEAKEGQGKPMRNMSKICGLAVAYLAKEDKVYETCLADGLPVKYVEVVNMLDTLHKMFKAYYEFVDSNVEFCRKHGYLKMGYFSGRTRWLGHTPSPSEVANGPIQTTSADIMNMKLLKIWKRMKKELPGAMLIAQIHDAGIFDVDEATQVKPMQKIIRDVMSEPIIIHEKQGQFPIDEKEGYRWSEI